MKKLLSIFVLFLFLSFGSLTLTGCANGTQVPQEVCDIGSQVCAALNAICEFYSTNSVNHPAPQQLLNYLQQVNDSLQTYIPDQ